MLSLPSSVRVFVARERVDFRKGFDGLCAIVRDQFGDDPLSGHLYLFFNARGNRVKILVWDGSGLVLVWKQLEGGAFRWPRVVDGVLRLTPVEFAALFDGIDWTRVQSTKRIPIPVAAA